jgi:hypothetical protein
MIKHSDEISFALKNRNKIVGLTASFGTINPRTFADNRQLSKLDSDGWQIIFGRRGSGKTTLLATYAQYITQTDRLRSASIEINVPDFLNVVETSGSRKIKDSELAQIYFDDFMKHITKHLFNVFSQANPQSKFFRFSMNSSKRRYIEDLVTKIHETTETNTESGIGVRKEVRKGRNVDAIAQSQKKGAAKLKIGVKEKDSLSIEGQLAADAGFERLEKTQTTENLQGTISYRNFKFNYSETRNLIEELLDALGFEKLYVFLDEWSELDRTGATEIQPFFADLIKRVFWKNPKFVLKIGAIRNHTRLNTTVKNGGIVGLELAADIFELNLDAVYAENEMTRVEFFEELVFKHLAACNEKLLDFKSPAEPSQNNEGTTYGTLDVHPLETFITHIFKSRDAFKLLVEGSGNLPRDFLEMIDAIAQVRKFSVDQLWTIKDVKNGVRDHYIRNKHSSIKNDQVLEDICSKIIAAVKKNKSRLIAVKNNSDSNILFGIANLYHRRFLHDVSLADIPPLLRNSHSFYYADLGMMLDVSREMLEDPASPNEECPLRGDEEAKDIENYIIE